MYIIIHFFLLNIFSTHTYIHLYIHTYAHVSVDGNDVRTLTTKQHAYINTYIHTYAQVSVDGNDVRTLTTKQLAANALGGQIGTDMTLSFTSKRTGESYVVSLTREAPP